MVIHVLTLPRHVTERHGRKTTGQRPKNLFPLNIQRSLPSSPILPDLQPSEHSDLLRHTAARHWGSTVTNTETQAKLGRVEFRFFVPVGNGVGRSDPKSSPSTANLQATCDYPMSVIRPCLTADPIGGESPRRSTRRLHTISRRRLSTP